MRTRSILTRTAFALIAVLALGACSDDDPTSLNGTDRLTPARALVSEPNPLPEAWGELEPVILPPVLPFRALLAEAMAGTLVPDVLTATLRAGETITEHKIATLPPVPPAGDVVFSMDLTGSMGGELNQMRINAVNILNAVAAVIPDVRFGLISYEDYPAYYGSCGYSAPYGDGADLPYRKNSALTSDFTSVATAIGGLTLGNGADGPESYSRVLYETFAELTPDGADPTYGPLDWRPGARKIVVNFADNIPHDCNVFGPIGGPVMTTGKDPGRDGVVETGDDLVLTDVIAGMAANNVTLINLFSETFAPSYYGDLWNWMAMETGGVSYTINSDGTMPGGVDIADQIATLIEAQVSMISSLTLGVCAGSEMYATWITNVDPASYSDIDISSGEAVREFDLTVGPPMGTPDGVYAFEVCAIGDGAELARQAVEITVRNVIDVQIDIKPGSFPNAVEPKLKGKLPVAVLTTPVFNAAMIDPATVTLGDELDPDTYVAIRNLNTGALFAALEDVDYDGDMDMVFHFDLPALVANGDLTTLTTALVLRGLLMDGTPIRGMDSVWIVPNP